MEFIQDLKKVFTEATHPHIHLPINDTLDEINKEIKAAKDAGRKEVLIAGKCFTGLAFNHEDHGKYYASAMQVVVEKLQEQGYSVNYDGCSKVDGEGTFCTTTITWKD